MYPNPYKLAGYKLEAEATYLSDHELIYSVMNKTYKLGLFNESNRVRISIEEECKLQRVFFFNVRL